MISGRVVAEDLASVDNGSMEYGAQHDVLRFCQAVVTTKLLLGISQVFKIASCLAPRRSDSRKSW